MNNLKQLGRYQIDKLIGSGAYAEVYRALDTTLQRTVALKVLKPALIADEEAFARFVQEARVTAGLFHPHIATVMDMGEAEGRYFIAMRYVEGPSLEQLLKQRGQLPWAEALLITKQIASALDFAHSKGFVHRDVKPSNILVSPDEGAVLTDFGLVKALETSGLGTRTGAILGTPQYIAPEVWQSESATSAADQYALACILAEMLSGLVLFDGSTPWTVMAKHAAPLALPTTWSSGVPPGIQGVIERALAKEPKERFASIGEFARTLETLPEGDGLFQENGQIAGTLVGVAAVSQASQLFEKAESDSDPQQAAVLASPSMMQPNDQPELALSQPISKPQPQAKADRRRQKNLLIVLVGSFTLCLLLTVCGGLVLEGLIGNGPLSFIFRLTPTMQIVIEPIPVTVEPTGPPSPTEPLLSPSQTLTMTPSPISVLTDTNTPSPSHTPTMTITGTSAPTRTPTKTPNLVATLRCRRLEKKGTPCP